MTVAFRVHAVAYANKKSTLERDRLLDNRFHTNEESGYWYFVLITGIFCCDFAEAQSHLRDLPPLDCSVLMVNPHGSPDEIHSGTRESPYCAGIIIRSENALYLATTQTNATHCLDKAQIAIQSGIGPVWRTFAEISDRRDSSDHPWIHGGTRQISIARLKRDPYPDEFFKAAEACALSLEYLSDAIPRRGSQVSIHAFPVGLKIDAYEENKYSRKLLLSWLPTLVNNMGIGAITNIVATSHVASRETIITLETGLRSAFFLSDGMGNIYSGGGVFQRVDGNGHDVLVGIFLGDWPDLTGASMSVVVPSHHLKAMIVQAK